MLTGRVAVLELEKMLEKLNPGEISVGEELEQ
jgi:hypothetical protein